MRTFSMPALWLAVVGFVASAPAAGPAPRGDLELEVASLTKLHDLELTGDQLRSFKKLAAQVTAGKPPAPGKMTPAYHAALVALRAAFVQADEEKIADAQDKVDDLRDEQDIEPQTEVTLSDSSRQHAPEAIELLTATQIASYLAEHSDDVPDALQTMLDAIDESRDMEDAEYASLKTEASEQVATLLAGLDPAAEEPIVKKVSQWLDRAKAMSEADVKSKRPQLEQAAKEIVGKADPMVQLRHWMEREMADLLANPQTAVALAARVK
jgi:hypothetical protein